MMIRRTPYARLSKGKSSSDLGRVLVLINDPPAGPAGSEFADQVDILADAPAAPDGSPHGAVDLVDEGEEWMLAPGGAEVNGGQGESLVPHYTRRSVYVFLPGKLKRPETRDESAWCQRLVLQRLVS